MTDSATNRKPYTCLHQRFLSGVRGLGEDDRMGNPVKLPIRLILQLCFLYIFSIGCAPKPPTIDRPNIILIYADDLGMGEIEPYGQEKIRTPHLSKMADEGIRFLQHYSGAPDVANQLWFIGYSFVSG